MSKTLSLQYKGVKVPTVIADRRMQCVYFNPACVEYPEIRMQADFLHRCLMPEHLEKVRESIEEGRLASFSLSLGSRGYSFQTVVRPGDAGVEIMLFPCPPEKEMPNIKQLRKEYAAGYRHLLSHELFDMMNAMQLTRMEGISAQQKQTQYDIVWRNIMRSIRTASHMNELLVDEEPAFMVINYAAFLRDIIEAANEYLEQSGWPAVEMAVPTDTVAVRADPIMLRTMVYNLISNAYRFSEKGSTVTVRLNVNETFTVLSVINDGVCSIETMLSVGRSQSGALGTGAGLPLVRKLVKLHQGQFMLHNTAEGKTAASLLLPLAETEPVLEEMVREVMDKDMAIAEVELCDLPLTDCLGGDKK